MSFKVFVVVIPKEGLVAGPTNPSFGMTQTIQTDSTKSETLNASNQVLLKIRKQVHEPNTFAYQ